MRIGGDLFLEKPFLLDLTSTEENLKNDIKDIDYRKNRINILGINSLNKYRLNKKILIFTRIDDPEIDYLGKFLLEAGIDYLRINAESIFTEFSYSIEVNDKLTGKINCNSTCWNIEDIDAVWFRHFSLDTIPKSNSNVDNMYVREQWGIFFTLLSNLDIRIISGFEAEKQFIKPLQIKLAKDVGFEVPNTLITNNKDEVKKYFGDISVFAKVLMHHNIEYKPNVLKHVYGRIINTDDYPKETFKIAPTIFQNLIENGKEIRVTFFGKYIFGTEYKNVEHTDWHDQGIYGFNMKEYIIPSKLKKKLERFIDKSGLYVGTIDLILVDNNCYFLEVNVNGDWRWLEVQTKQKISQKCIDFLKEVV